jgi:hypothetical protein
LPHTDLQRVRCTSAPQIIPVASSARAELVQAEFSEREAGGGIAVDSGEEDERGFSGNRVRREQKSSSVSTHTIERDAAAASLEATGMFGGAEMLRAPALKRGNESRVTGYSKAVQFSRGLQPAFPSSGHSGGIRRRHVSMQEELELYQALDTVAMIKSTAGTPLIGFQAEAAENFTYDEFDKCFIIRTRMGGYNSGRTFIFKLHSSEKASSSEFSSSSFPTAARTEEVMNTITVARQVVCVCVCVGGCGWVWVGVGG